MFDTPFDASRALLLGRDHFPRFRPPRRGVPLAHADLPDHAYLIIVSRRDESLGLVMRDMAFHHVAEGTLAGEPYLVSF
jgi:hypothetical protein